MKNDLNLTSSVIRTDDDLFEKAVDENMEKSKEADTGDGNEQAISTDTTVSSAVSGAKSQLAETSETAVTSAFSGAELQPAGLADVAVPIAENILFFIVFFWLHYLTLYVLYN